MTGKLERGIHELYRSDPERADAVVFGRRTDISRRGFLGGAGLAAMGGLAGGEIVFGNAMPGGLIPAAFAQDAKKDAAAKGPQLLQFPGKDANLVVFSGDPLDFKSVVDRVFIDGIPAYDRAKDVRLRRLLSTEEGGSED